MSARRAHLLAVVVAVVVAGCTDASPSPSAAGSGAPAASAIISPSANPSAAGSLAPPASAPASAPPTAGPSAPASATASPEPALSLDLPETRDERVVSVGVEPAVPPDGNGQITVTVTSAADVRIDELVLRWPSELNDSLFLTPFEPTDDRIREDGPPLVQPWTKWVLGPGEQGEPAGTISLGWGPLLPGATLTIPIIATRNAPGPVAFDLQVLAGNDLLTLEGGGPAEIRVEIP